MRSYDNVYVQGLLQTHGYAEAVIGNARTLVPPLHIDRLVELRMRRQQRLREDGFQGLVAVLTEGVIRTLVGGPDVMRDQLQHLIEVTQRYPVALHIPPFSAGALPGSDNVVIFGFERELDGTLVFTQPELAPSSPTPRTATSTTYSANPHSRWKISLGHRAPCDHAHPGSTAGESTFLGGWVARRDDRHASVGHGGGQPTVIGHQLHVRGIPVRGGHEMDSVQSPDHRSGERTRAVEDAGVHGDLCHRGKHLGGLGQLLGERGRVDQLTGVPVVVAPDGPQYLGAGQLGGDHQLVGPLVEPLLKRT